MRPRLPIWELQERGRIAVGALLRRSVPVSEEDELNLCATSMIMPWGFECSVHVVWGIDLGRTLAKAVIEWSSPRLDCGLLWPAEGGGIETRQNEWRRVEGDAVAPWRATFEAERRLVNLRGACPQCGAAALHRYFGSDGQKGYRGACGWEWCRGCGAYLFTRDIPEWWSGPGPDWTSVDEEPGALQAFLVREGCCSRAS